MRDTDPEMCEKMRDLRNALKFLDEFIEDWDEPCIDLLDWQRQALITIRDYVKELEELLEES